MKYVLLFFFCTFCFLSPVDAKHDDTEELPPVENGWDKKADGDRSLSSAPSLFKDVNHVYVYSEKQLDNVTIGITDMIMIDRDYDEYTFFPGMTDYSLHYLHMSWGDDPEIPSQAWYYQDNLPPTGNYTIARKIITVRPNK